MLTPYTIRAKSKASIPTCAAMLSILCLAQPCQAGWWETGSDLFNQLTGNSETPAVADLLNNEDIGNAFRQALQMGSETVVKQLGQTDGFQADSQIHIPLPQQLVMIKDMLAKIGMQGLADDLELKLNRAAEAATPKAKDLFVQSIQTMTFDDVMTIYQGPDDAATQYLQQKMTPQLSQEIQPLVYDSLSQVGTIQAYDQLIEQYKTLPFVPDIKMNLTQYVTEKSMDGIFHYLRQEEASIRSNPEKHTTDLLKKVFGGQ